MYKDEIKWFIITSNWVCQSKFTVYAMATKTNEDFEEVKIVDLADTFIK